MKENIESSQASHDPLLSCLLLIAKSQHITCSETSLVSGLPLVDGKLSPELFIRSAKRAGLDAKVVQKPLKDIPDIVFPVTLLLENDSALVLISRDMANGKVTVLEPDTGKEKVLDEEQLKKDYSGYAIYTQESYFLDDEIEKTHIRQDKKDHWFWSIMASSWRIYRDVLLASLFINLFAIANPLFVMNVYDRVVPNNAVETLWVLAIGVLIVFLFDATLKGLRGYFIEVAGKKADVLLSSFLLDRVLGSRFSEKPSSVGAFTSQFRDFDQVRSFYASSTVAAFIDLPFVVIFLLLTFYIGGAIVVIPLLALCVIFAYSFLMRKPIQKAIEQTYATGAQKNAVLVESITGLETVKALGAEGVIQRMWEQSVGHLSIWSQKMRLYSLSVGVFSGAITQVSQVSIVIFGVYSIAERDMTIGALIASVILAGRVLAPVSQVVTLMLTYDQTKIALEGLNGIVNKKQERDSKKPFVKRSDFKGEIKFNNVTFNYPDEEQAAIESVSFTVKSGEKVGIIGRIGSGKSTIHKLMLNLYKPTEGSILLDGIDIQQIDPADLRKNLGYMPQDITLFSGTIKTNIMYGFSHVDDEKVVQAAEVSCVNDFVNNHPLGFDRAVGERGQALSGGQRQSVGMARAMLRDVPVYLFDEPTSGMDSTTESKVTQNLQESIKDKTVLLVTHKAALLQLVDRLIVLDNGKIIADGAKDAVLKSLQKGDLRAST